MNSLQLDDYFLTKLSLEFILPDDGSELSDRFDMAFDFEVLTHSNEPLRKKMILKFQGSQKDKDGNPAGNQIGCDIGGIFMMPEEWPSKSRDSLFLINGISILYSTMRGLVGSMSGSFPGGRLCLPTILPQEIVKDTVERIERSQKNKSREVRSLKEV